MPWFRLLSSLALALALGCGEDAAAPADPQPDAGVEPNGDEGVAEPAQVVTPPSGSSSGYYTVTLDLSDLEVDSNTVTAATFGGVAAYDLVPTGNFTLEATVQGHGSPGAIEVVITAAGGDTSLGEVFEYDAPLDSRFVKVMAIGASLSQGVQRGTPSKRGGLVSPPAWIARQMGAWMGLPLVHEGLFPQLQVEDVGPPPDCEIPDFLAEVEEQSAEILFSLQDPETQQFGYQYARIDPEVEVRNISVGGTHLADIVHGPAEDDLPINFLSHIIYDPFGEFLTPIAQGQVEVVEQAQPTLVVGADIYGNDIIKGIVNGELIDPERMTPLAELQTDLEELVERLAATDAEVFLATLPHASLLPATAVKRAQMLALEYEADDIDARILAVEERGDAVNATLIELASQHENVHAVDIALATAGLAENGLIAGEHTLTGGLFGGLLSLDGVHFTDAGYAMFANAFLIEINSVLETEIPLINVGAVYEDDPESLESYLAQGFDPSACESPGQ